MSVSNSANLIQIDQAEFSKLNYHVMRLAFETQKQLGRLCEEHFRLTAFTGERETWRESLRALLGLSPLRRLQWVNLGRQEIRFVTVER